jgi:hypothetical protein
MFLNWLIGETGLDMNCTNLKTLGGEIPNIPIELILFHHSHIRSDCVTNYLGQLR